MRYYLDFEKPIQEMEIKIEELKRLSNGSDIKISAEIKRLERKTRDLHSEIFSSLNPWQKTQVARHPERPYTLDYIAMTMSNWVELHGDRRFSDDPALIGGLANLGDTPVVVIGHQKGRGVKERIGRNFGQPHPEGYRKALRVMRLAEQFGLPVISLIDTPGAYPGIEAEERGQVEAIARNIQEMFEISVPIVSTVIGEGGSGGALALGVGDRVLMMENSIYSVISPEACAAILWNDPAMSAEAASQLRMTARHLQGLGIVDEIIPEPEGGAQKDVAKVSQTLKSALIKALSEIEDLPHEELRSRRYEKFHGMVRFRLLS